VSGKVFAIRQGGSLGLRKPLLDHIYHLLDISGIFPSPLARSWGYQFPFEPAMQNACRTVLGLGGDFITA
jgi:hypothetical protein